MTGLTGKVTILQIERAAFAAWPAELVEECDGWQFRFTHGVTGRANSVWPNEAHGRLPLSEKIAAAESFYQRYKLPARFQINPAAQPAHLEFELRRRGYQIISPTSVQTAVLKEALWLCSPSKVDVDIQADAVPAEAWLAFQQAAYQYDEVTMHIRQGIMSRIPSPRQFALARIDGHIVGIGTAVCVGQWMCIMNMHVAAEFRRQGVATALLGHLVRWGLGKKATDGFLQVVAANNPAKRLYQNCGFKEVYGYKYLVKP